MAKKIALGIVATLLVSLVWLLAAAAGIGRDKLPLALAVLFLFWVTLAVRPRSERAPAAAGSAEALKAKVERLPQLTLSEYRDLVAGLPAPSPAQQENFARFVSEARRWHLLPRLCPPGYPFSFFIDPFAGCGRVAARRDAFPPVPRRWRGGHRSELSIQEYRERYGYLAFSCTAAADEDQFGGVGPLALGDDIAAVTDRTGRLRALPPEVRGAGTVRLTAAIHPHSAGLPWWDEVAPGRTDDLNWPDESGGMQALQRIFERCRELRAEISADPRLLLETVEPPGKLVSELLDPILHSLLTPERERQQRAMVEAMGRSIALIYGPQRRT